MGQSVSEADHYRVQLDTDEGFFEPQVDEQVSASSLSVGDLAEATRYSWRVQACPPAGEGACSAWATTSFTTQGVPPSPPAPLLDRPADGATDVSLLPAFAWTAVAEADVYQLLLADNDAFDPQRWRVAVAQNQHVLPAHQALEAQTVYHWQVASGRLVGADTTWGVFSSVWTFTTGTSTEPPGPPTLDSPEDGAVLGPVTSVVLAWTAPAGGAVSYTVEVAQDSVFTQGVRSYPGVEGESFQVMDLVEDRWYWWRVQSCDGGQACSSWSDPVRRFYTGALAVQRYYYVKDHLGSVRATVDEGGVVVHYDDYYPFGAPMPGRGMDDAAPRERFTGHELEDDIDPDFKATYYAGARYYDALVPRWNAIDPKDHLFPSHSPYDYALNNPINLTDPNGQAVCPPFCGDFLRGTFAGAVTKGAENYLSLTESLSTSEGRVELLRSFAPIAPVDEAEFFETPGAPRSLAESLAPTVEAVEDIMTGIGDKVAEGIDVMLNGSDFERGKFVGGAAMTLAVAVISRRGAFRQAKRDLGLRMNAEHTVRRVPMTDRNGRAILGADGRPIMTREYVFTREDGSVVVIQDHSAGHQFGEGGRGDQNAHFNVRPGENTRTGRVPGTRDHYEYDN